MLDVLCNRIRMAEGNKGKDSGYIAWESWEFAFCGEPRCGDLLAVLLCMHGTRANMRRNLLCALVLALCRLLHSVAEGCAPSLSSKPISHSVLSPPRTSPVWRRPSRLFSFALASGAAKWQSVAVWRGVSGIVFHTVCALPFETDNGSLSEAWLASSLGSFHRWHSMEGL